MKLTMNRLFAPLALALAVAGLTGCGGVEGTYKLDKTEMKKSMEAEIAKLPEEQQGFAKLGVALMDAMEMSVELESGGKLKMKSSMPSLKEGEEKKSEEKEGTWKQEGDSVILVTDGKELKCKNAGGKLTCEADKKGEAGLVLVKS